MLPPHLRDPDPYANTARTASNRCSTTDKTTGATPGPRVRDVGVVPMTDPVPATKPLRKQLGSADPGALAGRGVTASSSHLSSSSAM